MIDQSTLLSFLNMFADERQLEKDYLLNLMLKSISVSNVSNYLEFKGGTALYIMHGLDRFSEDLDFSYIGDADEAAAKIDGLLNQVINNFGLSYSITKQKGNILIRNREAELEGIRSEFFVEGPLFGRNHTRHKIKIDISLRKDRVSKPIAAKFVSKYYDIGTILVYAMPIEEMLAEKLCAIIERNKARDLYDAFFIMKYKGIAPDENLIAKKMEFRSEEFDTKMLVKGTKTINEREWKEELKYLVKELPDLKAVKDFVISKLEN